MSQRASLQVRVAAPDDGPDIRHLLIHTSRPPLRGWSWEEHLGRETFLLARCGDRLVGTLLAWPDAGPVAWVQLAALAGDVGVGLWLDATLPPLWWPLRRLGVHLLGWIDGGEWAGAALGSRGFRRLTRLVGMAKQDRWLPANISSPAHIRAVEEGDLPALARLDRAAFSPPWWLSRSTLERLRQGALCFLVAGREQRCLGYGEARLVEYGAHIGRLAVDPRAQGQGIGGALLAGLLSRLWGLGIERVTLNTQEGNRASLRLYHRFGFQPLERRVPAWARWL